MIFFKESEMQDWLDDGRPTSDVAEFVDGFRVGRDMDKYVSINFENKCQNYDIKRKIYFSGEFSEKHYTEIVIELVAKTASHTDRSIHFEIPNERINLYKRDRSIEGKQELTISMSLVEEGSNFYLVFDEEDPLTGAPGEGRIQKFPAKGNT